MNRLFFLSALLFALLVAFALRSDPSHADARLRGSPYVELDDADSSYRMRLVELVLVDGSAPPTDRFLDPQAEPRVPWPPLVHSALAFTAARVLERDTSRELAGFDESDLLVFASWVGPLLGASAALVAALAGSVLVDPRRRLAAASAAALLYAVLPIAVARETSGSLHAHPWIALLAFAELAAFAVALRAREPIDVTVGALVCGLFAGLALLAGQESWPLSVAIFGVFLVLALRAKRESKRDSWRAVLLFTASALAVISLGRSETSLEGWLPSFSGTSRGLLAASPWSFLIVLAPLAGASWIVVRDRVDPSRAALLGAAFVSFPCALFDRRFLAPLAVATVALVVAAASGSWVRERRSRLRAIAGAYVMLLMAAMVAWFAGPRPTQGMSAHDACLTAMHWLRDQSSSPGAFNHPDDLPSWRVASAPALAGTIAFHARRPVLAASFEGAPTPSLTALSELLSAPDVEQFQLALARADCAYVVVSPRMLEDPALPEAARRPGGVLEQLALAPADSAARIGDLERMHASQRLETSAGRERSLAGEPRGPALSIWFRNPGLHRGSELLAPKGPQVRSR